jgi:uncharacterized RDD family membrane protein YckC
MTAIAPAVVMRSSYAGLASRVTALAVDAALLTVVGLSISVLPGLAWNEVIGTSPGWLGVASGIVAGLLPWLYFTFCWWSSGQTAGDLLIGIGVERASGRRVSVLQAALRAAIGLAFAPVWLVGFVGILVDRRRRAWHDVVFRTVVRHRNPHSDPQPEASDEPSREMGAPDRLGLEPSLRSSVPPDVQSDPANDPA